MDEAPKKGKKKLIIMVVGAAAVAGGAFFFLSGGDEAAAEEPEVVEVVEGPVIEGDQMTVNLADDEPRYARLKFAVVLPEGSDSAAVGERIPLLKDAILDVVSEYDAEALRAPSALDELRTEFTERSASVWPDGEVLRVVITELLVQ